MYITFFPIYGFVLGINYTDSYARGKEVTHYNEHQLQFLFLFFGITIGWYTDCWYKG
jgi:hypothetical protein